MELSRRDQLAMAFMTAWVTGQSTKASVTQAYPEAIAKAAYEVADAMVAEADRSLHRGTSGAIPIG